jgi:crotonobetainyl-CoA:carnitine CoA-transferase CaiB-like acyl-CoA transferase
MLALYNRRRTGKGQHIDASLYGAQLFLAAPTLQAYLASRDGRYADQQSRKQARNPLWNRYAASDGWLFLCVENDDDGWRELCESMERLDLVQDRRFASAADRRENAAGLIVLLDEIIAGSDSAEWMERWKAKGIAASPIHSFRDLAQDEQAWANGYFSKLHCDEAGEEVAIRGLPVGLSKTPGSVETLGPELGQDTELILFEVLGIDWDRIGELKELGVIP